MKDSEVRKVVEGAEYLLSAQKERLLEDLGLTEEEPETQRFFDGRVTLQELEKVADEILRVLLGLTFDDLDVLEQRLLRDKLRELL